uniref:Aldehyde dehydrogenase 3 family, member B1 n=1 Tax=Oryzias sinensis TaxID=183150 RepID=A0A8C7ZXG3_9TELE
MTRRFHGNHSHQSGWPHPYRLKAGSTKSVNQALQMIVRPNGFIEASDWSVLTNGTANSCYFSIAASGTLASWSHFLFGILSAASQATKLDDCFIRREPLGVVLIIGPWNYPLQLLILPLISAIAAGICASVAGMVLRINGGKPHRTSLRTDPNPRSAVARSVVQAASVHLTPVTLELGGKCPCLIYGRINITAAARRLVWAKYFNAGQSCVAPDYLLCTKAVRDALVPALREILEEFYGKEPKESPDVSRIVSDRHWTRLMELLKKTAGTVVVGGEANREDKYIAPTVVVDLQEDDALMGQEIFGPILPILTVETLEEGIAFINRKEKPLALYVFSDESSTVMENTSSGGFCSNDAIIHMTLPSLPFGGVGMSGWGSYHGRWGFEEFSHRRACMLRGWALERLNGLRYPPYSSEKLKWLLIPSLLLSYFIQNDSRQASKVGNNLQRSTFRRESGLCRTVGVLVLLKSLIIIIIIVFSLSMRIVMFSAKIITCRFLGQFLQSSRSSSKM